jgi:ribosomal protein L11 methyltransferase
MAWRKLQLSAPAAQAEDLSDALMECGALSVTIEELRTPGDTEQELFGEPGQPHQDLWNQCQLDVLLPPDADEAEIVAAALNAVEMDAHTPWQSDILGDEDWVTLTQRQFDPIPVAPKLWIVPSWHQPPEPDALNIRLDPGCAFGTGSHPTTRLCLGWLADAQLNDESVLDYGCGSGILAIAAKLLGAGSVVGVDLDPAAVETAKRNASENSARARFYLPDDEPNQIYDRIVANILAAPLMMLAPALCQRLRPGGKIALSGILERQAQDVMAAYAPWCTLEVHALQEGWVCLAGQRSAG